MSKAVYNRGKLWPTRAQAIRVMRSMKRRAVKRIRRRGDVVIQDNSFIMNTNIWEDISVRGAIAGSRMTDKIAWKVYLNLFTRNLYRELIAIHDKSKLP